MESNDCIHVNRSSCNINIRFTTINELGGFKNDYGEGVLVTEAYFLDVKRYYLDFDVNVFVLGFEFLASGFPPKVVSISFIPSFHENTAT